MSNRLTPLLLSIALLVSSCFAQLQTDRLNPKAVADTYYANAFSSIQAAITQAGSTGAVIIPASYAGLDTYTNPNGILIMDFRNGGLGIGTGAVFSAATGNLTNINSIGTDSLGTVTVSGTETITGALTATGGISAGGTTSILSGVSTNTDLNGEVTMVSGTKSYVFANTYISHPICMAVDQTSIAAVKVTYTATTSVTFTTSGSTDVVDYQCTGRN